MTSRNASLIAWDTCVLLDYIERKNPTVDQAEVAVLVRLVQEAKSSKIPLLIAAVVVAEITRGHKAGSEETYALSEQQIHEVRQFLRNEEFEVRPVDREVAHIAQDLMRQGLSLADALVTGVCIRHKAAVLLTRDGIRRKKKKSKLIAHDNQHGSPLLRIMRPSVWEKHELAMNAPLFHEKPPSASPSTSESEPPS